MRYNSMADFGLARSQWEAVLQSTDVSHWLGANLKSAMWFCHSWAQFNSVYFNGELGQGLVITSNNNKNKKQKQRLLLLTHVISVNKLRPRQSGRHFSDDFLKCIFLNENMWVSIKISLMFVPKVWINNIPALVQIMAGVDQAIIWTNGG